MNCMSIVPEGSTAMTFISSWVLGIFSRFFLRVESQPWIALTSRNAASILCTSSTVFKRGGPHDGKKNTIRNITYIILHILYFVKFPRGGQGLGGGWFHAKAGDYFASSLVHYILLLWAWGKLGARFIRKRSVSQKKGRRRGGSGGGGRGGGAQASLLGFSCSAVIGRPCKDLSRLRNTS